MTDNNYVGPTTRWGAFTDRNSHALLLNLILLEEFGTEYIGWEPTTVWSEIESVFRTATSDVNKSRINAIRACISADTPYTMWDVFEKVAVALDGSMPVFDMIQKPPAAVCAVALETMAYVRADVKVSKSVRRYIAAVMLDEGIAYGPGALEPSNEYLLKYVDVELQARVKRASLSGDVPSFDGVSELDYQVYKTNQIKDYVSIHNRALLDQMAAVMEAKTK